MTSTFNKRKGDLQFICDQHHTYRRELLKHIDDGLVKCICHCTTNILNGKLPISSNDKKKLRKHKVILRKLDQPKTTTATKKRLIVQSGGGFLLGLIPAVIGALASLIR
jgi:hypothetical protein